MALIRLTCCPDAAPGLAARWALGVPEEDGTWHAHSYRDGRGMLGLLDAPGVTGRALAEHLRHLRAQRLDRLDPNAPITVLIHGFQYEPRAPVSHDRGRAANPHAQIFHFTADTLEVERRAHSTPWPLRLGYADDRGETGVAVAFGWTSDPAFVHGDWRDWLSRLRWSEMGAETYYGSAYRTAPMAARGLAIAIAALAEVFGRAEIDLYAHSLGARVALRGLSDLAARDSPRLRRVGRVILVSGASHGLDARRALDRVAKVGRHRPQIFNLMVSRDATLGRWGRRFAAFAEARDAPPRWRDRLRILIFGAEVIGLHGKPRGARLRSWMDLYLDRPALQNWASRAEPPLDFRPPWRGASGDHWAGFTWPGYTAFCTRILREREGWSLGALRWGAGRRSPVPQGSRGTGPLAEKPGRLLRLRAWLRLLAARFGRGGRGET